MLKHPRMIFLFKFNLSPILETQSDPYPVFKTIIGQVPLIAAGQLFFFITTIIIGTIIMGFMAASNTAFSAVTPKDIAQLKKSTNKRDKVLLRLLDRPASLQATITITYTIFMVVTVIIFSFLLSRLVFIKQHIIFDVIIYTLVISFFLLLTALYVPKVYAAKNHVKFCQWMSYPLIGLQWVNRPIIELLLVVTKGINKIINKRYRFSENEFNILLNSDLINEENEEERLILKGIANFGNISVKQIMRSRMDVVAFDFETDITDVFQKIKDTRYSRIPIYEKNLDSIKGILYVKDILIQRENTNFSWQNLIRPAYFVPENKKIDDLLKEFKTKHTHIAIVVDEYGGTSGIVTLEDILEEIVGDISDEYDEADDELRYSKLDDYNYVFDGKTPLNDLYRLLNLDESTFEDIRGEADTLGGLVLAIAGRFLFINEKVSYQNFTFTVESADRRRIKRVKVTIKEYDESQ